MISICDTVLHEIYIIHCDIKPDNILLLESDTCRISEPDVDGTFVFRASIDLVCRISFDC